MTELACRQHTKQLGQFLSADQREARGIRASTAHPHLHGMQGSTTELQEPSDAPQRHQSRCFARTETKPMIWLTEEYNAAVQAARQ